MDYLDLVARLSVSELAVWTERQTLAMKENKSPTAIDVIRLLEETGGGLRLALLCELLTIEMDRRNLHKKSYQDEDEYIAAYPEIGDEIRVAIDFLDWKTAPFPESVDDYTLLSLWGMRRHSRVFRARSKLSKKDVTLTLSVCAGTGFQEWRQVLREESAALRAVRHKSIVLEHFFGNCNGRAYLVTPLLEVPLSETLRYSSPQTATTLAREFAAVVAGVHAAHDRKIYHHEITPHSVYVTESGQIVLSSFGIGGLSQSARAIVHTAKEEVEIIRYMSPEQIQGDFSNSVAIDIFGLGATLFSVLTGKAPYPVDGARELAATCSWDREALKASPFPKELRRICEKAMEAKPGDRFTSAVEMCEALRQFAEVPARKTRVKQTATAFGIATLIIGLIVAVIVLSTPPIPPASVAPPQKPSWIETKAIANNIDLSKLTPEDFKLTIAFTEPKNFIPHMPGMSSDYLGTLLVKPSEHLSALNSAVQIRIGKAGDWYSPVFDSDKWALAHTFGTNDLARDKPVEVRLYSAGSTSYRSFEAGPFQYDLSLAAHFRKQFEHEIAKALAATWIVDQRDLRWQLAPGILTHCQVVRELTYGVSADALTSTVFLNDPYAALPTEPYSPLKQRDPTMVAYQQFDQQILHLNNPTTLYTQLRLADGSSGPVVRHERGQSHWEELINVDAPIHNSDGLWELSHPIVEAIQVGVVREILAGPTAKDLRTIASFDPMLFNDRTEASISHANTKIRRFVTDLSSVEGFYVQINYIAGKQTPPLFMSRRRAN